VIATWRQVVKKIESNSELRKDNMNHNISKLPRVRVPKRDSEDLTCSEGQVEDLLSEGESTEAEGAEDNRSDKRKQQQQNPSPR